MRFDEMLRKAREAAGLPAEDPPTPEKIEGNPDLAKRYDKMNAVLQESGNGSLKEPSDSAIDEQEEDESDEDEIRRIRSIRRQTSIRPLRSDE